MSVTSQRQIRILHVDDEPSFTDLTETYLEREDDQFTVETATSADEGLQRITDRPPDCVVSDYNMPGVDGLEFLQAVREEYPDLPFILYTGKGSEAVASEAIACDVTDYLQKGSASEQYELLANRIQNAVQARRERQRAARQEQLMRLTEFAGDTGGFELDTETGEVEMTDGIRRIADLSGQADLSLNEAIELYHPEDREDIQRAIDRARRTGEQTHGTWRLQTPDGDERLMDVTLTPATTDGDREKLRGAVHDITDQHERQQELKTERRFITQTLDSLDDLFYVIDEDGTLRRWNEKALEVTGYSESALEDMLATDLFPEDERQKVARAVDTTLTDGEVSLEADLLTADGERVPYEFSAARLTDENGDTTGLVGIGRDLTERRKRDRRFRALVEESNDVISIVDADGRYQYQSPSLEDILGYVPEDTVGDTAWEYIHPDDREAVIEEFETWVANPDQLDLIEYRARHADGSWRWMEAEGNNQFDNPAVEGYVVNSRDVTDRRERQHELQQTRDLLSNMEELADTGAWEYDTETEQLMITDGTRQLYGLDPDADLTLEGALDAVHPEDRDSLAERLSTCLETGEPYDINVRLNTHNGGQRWLTARGERVTDGESSAVVRGYIRDITEQRRRQDELEAERRFIQQALGSLDDLFYVTDEDGRLRRWNDRVSQVTGYTDSELAGMAAFTLFPDDEHDKIRDARETTRKDGTVTFETVLLTADGERIPYEFTGGFLTNEDGTPTGLVGIGRDITDHKDRNYRELAEEYEALLETSGDAIFMVDVETTGEDPTFEFARLSPGYETQTGITTEEVRGKTPKAVFGDEQGSELKANYTRCVEQRAPISYREEVNIADDAQFWETSLAPVIVDTEVIRIVGIARNVTAQVEREGELRRQNERLEEFASIVSHDLRSPLRVADGRLELMRQECESDQIDEIAQALDRIDALIADVLTLAREGETVDETELVGLADVATRSWQTVNTEQATLETDASRTVTADQSRLRQLFENLYRNAVEHGGDDVTVSVGTMDDGFYVADTGPGIPERDRGEVFEAGYSTNEDGTGFGLRIVGQIADAHGWTIALTESEQGGARFEFTGVEPVAH